MNDINYFGQTNHRRRKRKFGIKENDRFSHTYIIGKTGVGKTSLLKTKISQDIKNGKGFAVFDPHGDLAKSVIQMIPPERQRDLVNLDATDPNLNISYNPLQRVSEAKRPLVASGLLEIFKKIFTDAWGTRLEHILRCVILTLLDQPKADLSDIQRALIDKEYREQCLSNIKNTALINFWEKEFPNYTQTALVPLFNKIGAFLMNPVISKIFIENDQDISLRRIMDGRKILIINLSKGRIGEDASNLLGSVFLTSLGLAAFSRQDIPNWMRIPYFVYVDEFQSFTTLFLSNVLSEIRKMSVGFILANQFLDQLKPEIRNSVMGNVGTLIVFRTGVSDAQYLSKELNGLFKVGDITHLPNYNFYIRLMINGQVSDGFSSSLIP